MDSARAGAQQAAMKPIARALAALPLLLAAPAPAQVADAPTGTSKPQPVAVGEPIPEARDVPYPGTIRLQVDTTDLAHAIFRVKETVPVQPGRVTLLYPKWLPGDHNPGGPISKLAGLTVTAGGKPIAWRRDPVDVTAFHVDVPAGIAALDLAFQFLSPNTESQGRIQMTPAMLSLEWNQLVLYPAGFFVRQIMVQPSVTYPAGWTSATALRPSGKATAAGGTIDYGTVALDTLVDSPVIAGRHARIEELQPGVTLDILADRPDQLAATPEQLASLRSMAGQAVKLFGAQHYNHYDFLLTLSDTLGGVGLEHHRSSEDGSDGDFFTDWDGSVAERDVLAHEFTHSWNGKFRRPADLWTPDYRRPMGDTLLWVYEGQTQFWGNVLDARSGVVAKADALDALASVAAGYSAVAGRRWRPVADTTFDPIIAARRPAPWSNWQRSEDYYEEGQLVWLDADSLIREKTGGRRSLDDFARAFFGTHDRDWGEVTYTFDDVVATLDKVMPYDWATFLRTRIYDVAPQAPLDWIARGGYRLVYTDTPGPWLKSLEKRRKATSFAYSLGLTVDKEGQVKSVVWDSPAFAAGLTNGTKIVAVEGRAYDPDTLKAAVTAAKGGTQPIALVIRKGDAVETVAVRWNGGLRYPHLERAGKGPSTLDALLAARK